MPDPITAPYGVKLGWDEPAKDAVEDSAATLSAGTMKLHIGSGVNPKRMQSVVGSLRACYRALMFHVAKHGTGGAAVARGDGMNAADGNIVIESVPTGVGASDVAILVSSSFLPAGKFGGTQFYTETFDQLINVLLQNAKGT